MNNRFSILLRLTLFNLLVFPAICFSNNLYYRGNNYQSEMFATPIVCLPQCLKGGIYFGAGLGYDSYKFRQDLTLVDDDGDVFMANPPLASRGWYESIFAGYGQYFNRFYIAGEVLAAISNNTAAFSISATDTTYSGSITPRASYGAAILPGIKLSLSTLFYVRVGYVRTTFKSQESLTLLGTRNSSSTAKYGNGVNLGVGIETAFYRNLSLRGEYNYVNYSAFSSTFGSKFSPSNSQFVLSVIYHLDHLNYFVC